MYAAGARENFRRFGVALRSDLRSILLVPSSPADQEVSPAFQAVPFAVLVGLAHVAVAVVVVVVAVAAVVAVEHCHNLLRRYRLFLVFLVF